MPRIFLIFAVCLMIPMSTHASQIVEQYTEKPLPEVPLLEEGALAEKTVLYDETPYDDKSLAYSIRLPKGWSKRSEQNVIGEVVVPNFLREIARFDSPSQKGLRSRFVIRAEKLEEDISALQWYLQLMQMNAYTSRGFDEQGRNRLEAFYVLIEDSVEYAVRGIIEINADKLIFAEYYLPTVEWANAPYQNSAIKSFKLKNVEDIVLESYELYSYLDLMEFSYPASWAINTFPSRGADRFRAEMINVRDESTLEGRIDLRMILANESDLLAKEIDDYKWELTTKGLILGPVIESRDFEYRKGINLGAVEIYELDSREDRAIGYELIFGILAGRGQYFIVTMTTPARDEDFFLWSRNIETFQRVVESIQPYE